jgi:hypothetical protein
MKVNNCQFRLTPYIKPDYIAQESLQSAICVQKYMAGYIWLRNQVIWRLA